MRYENKLLIIFRLLKKKIKGILNLAVLRQTILLGEEGSEIMR